jgi:hypothetical protein
VTDGEELATERGGDFDGGDHGLEQALEVADTVLYEGYLLYPYRRSSAKNQVRWQFGVLGPRAWAEARGPVREGVAGSTEWWWQQTDVLLRAPRRAVVGVVVRFLQVVRCDLEALGADGTYGAVDELLAGDRRLLATEQARACELSHELGLAGLLDAEHVAEHVVPGGREEETVLHAAVPVGRVVRVREPLRCTIWIAATPVAQPGLVRLRIRTANTVEDLPPAASREVALRRSLVATHTLLRLDRGAFVSAIDPDPEAAPAVAAARNVRTFPVLAGPTGSSGIVLSAPIILEDHPRVAPESPGDLYDAAEIDEILTLRTMTLTDDEKAEARATDPRAAALLERVDAMPEHVLARLHGALRPGRPTDRAAASGAGDVRAKAAERSRPRPAWWEPGGDDHLSPGSDAVAVGGQAVARGARVLLRPGARNADPHDMFLAGRSALVEAVFQDVEGGVHIAVTIEDDPLAGLQGAVGRYRYFRPDELEPLPGEPGRNVHVAGERPPGEPDPEEPAPVEPPPGEPAPPQPLPGVTHLVGPPVASGRPAL